MPPIASHLSPGTVLCPDSLESALLDAAVPEPGGERLRHVPVLGRRGELPDDLRGPALSAEARAVAVPGEAVGAIDAEAVAEWIVGRYTASHYPAVVLGSPHGSAVHLAAAMRAAWLPAGFAVRVPWPGGRVGDWRRAAEEGGVVADRIMSANPGVSVRQVHDPILDGPLSAATLTMHVRWRRLPTAYGNFLRSRLRPGAMSLVLRDVRTWPVVELGPGHTLQVGSPVTGLRYDEYDTARPSFAKALQCLGEEDWSRPGREAFPRYAERAAEPGLEPQLRELAAESGHRAHRVLYRGPAALSGLVADLYREHLPDAPACLIESDRLLDPQGVIERGLVPYWCESAAAATVTAAEEWMAGSRPFPRVVVLPGAPGTAADAHARLRQWRSLAAFGSRGGWVDRQAAGRYPRLPLARSNAVRVTAETGPPERPMPPVKPEQIVAGLRRQGPLLGMFVG
jgi:hypothetical protein